MYDSKLKSIRISWIYCFIVCMENPNIIIGKRRKDQLDRSTERKSA